MKQADRERWWDKNERLNAGAELRVGDHITDGYGASGVITGIDAWEDGGPLSVENHGAVDIVLDGGEAEHFVLFGWQRFFRRS